MRRGAQRKHRPTWRRTAEALSRYTNLVRHEVTTIARVLLDGKQPAARSAVRVGDGEVRYKSRAWSYVERQLTERRHAASDPA